MRNIDEMPIIHRKIETNDDLHWGKRLTYPLSTEWVLLFSQSSFLGLSDPFFWLSDPSLKIATCLVSRHRQALYLPNITLDNKYLQSSVTEIKLVISHNFLCSDHEYDIEHAMSCLVFLNVQLLFFALMHENSDN